MANRFPKDINYYQILQVDPHADFLVIKSAYYTLLNQLKGHSDKGGDDGEAVLDEFRYGSFLRTFRLPPDVAVEKISASLTDGYLEIIVPAAARETGIKIPITEI